MEWLGGLGIVAFLFFLIKGLLWLVIPTLGVVVAKRRLAARQQNADESPTTAVSPEA
ncbi:MAG: hypothetical protein R3B57_00165 [Phycisphaerales bacterium]